MAGNRIKGITIEIGGNTTKLTESLKGVDKSLKDTQSKLKDVNKLLKMDPSNVELLRQKHELLGKAVKDTETRQKELKKALEDAKNAGDTTKAKEQQDALQRELVETTEKLKDLKKEYDSFGSAGAQAVAAVGEKFKEAGDKISGVGKSMTTTVTAPLVGLFTLAAAGASDLEENLNKVDVAFGNDAQSVKDWAENATTQFGLSKNAALEATSLFGDMGTAMGLTTGDAAEMSMNLAGLAGDLSSFKNIDIETAMNALKGVFTGETESLKGLGVIMNQTNLKEFADGLGLVYDEMSQTELVNLRYNYVLEATKNAQGDYARTSDGTANSIRTLQATVSNLAAELGSALLPIITPIIQKITEWAQKFAALDEGTKNTIVTVALVVAALGPLLTVIGSVISAIGTVMTLAPAISAAISVLMGPIGAVIAIVALLAVTIATNWESIKTWTLNLVQNISSALENIRSTMSSVFSSIPGIISGAISGLVGIVSGVFNGIKDTISNAINGAKDVVTSAVNTIKGAFNFSWSLPPIKLPHFSVSGGEPPWGIMGKGSLPKISVSWYKKAYENAVMFTTPTVLPTLGGLKGFGEGSGSELVIGTNKLREIVGASGNNINVNVYAAPGMNETAVANAVALKLDRWLGERV